MSKEIFIKNPERNKPQNIPEKYIPEHKRLDVKPSRYERTPDEEFISVNRKKITDTQQLDSYQLSTLSALKKGLIDKEEAEALLLQHESKNRNINLKTDDEESPESNSLLMKKEVYDEEIYDEEISTPPNNEYEQSSNENVDFSFENIEPGSYVLIHKDSVVDTGKVNQIKETLSNMLLAYEGSANVDDFVLMKRINVKMGIFIDD
jgi:hypothetical protein